MQPLRQLTSSTLITRAITGRFLSTSTALNMPIKVGDTLPDVELYEDNPGNKVSVTSVFGSGKSLIFAVPGAFTPTCHKEHAPSYITNIDQFKAKGISTVACISVNDPFVMAEWGKALGANGKVRMLADTCGEFTKAVEMDMDLTAALGSVRSKRYAMVVEDKVVKAIAVEPDNTGLACSAALEVMKLL